MTQPSVSFGPGLRLERDGRVATLVLDRPEQRNALTGAMWRALPGVCDALVSDPTVRVLIVRGAGDEAFSAGADIAEMQQLMADPKALHAFGDAVQVGQDRLAALALPTIARIAGACTGGGCGIAMACDLRIASDDSFFAIPPARLGLVYSLADTLRVVDLVGPSRAKDMLFTGRRVSAREAHDWGLLNQVVPRTRLDAALAETISQLAGVAHSSVVAAKRIVAQIAAGARSETAESRRLYDESFAGKDFQEGARAFLGKRKPEFE
jgi:enoyl-CoA hydratase/carnithine racemase